MAKIQVVWRGPLLDATGYGRASREYVRALVKQGVDVKVETWTWGSQLHGMDRDENGWIDRLIKKPYAENMPKVFIYHSPPWNIDLTKERKKFGRVILFTVGSRPALHGSPGQRYSGDRPRLGRANGFPDGKEFFPGRLPA